ncbi:transcription factor bHLH145 [Manihot esculenta]|uniref:Uncharacterized protein n=1 Tax=Manihot esculenta TaxID=3983 RepID=A0ACB7FYV6_MANES|nr:transcription factor bHLH145 [Manihot esculenta]XP_043809323.1 transcription factor bHLH145 [Manihot esculenta]KAG8632849.1 hypothetical protein MANES_18G061300v8 [Manihot esculenta]
MGEDWGSWFPQQQFNWKPPNLNHLGSPYNFEHQNTTPSFMNAGTEMVSIKGTLPVYPSPEVPHPHIGQANEPHGWFYCLPRFRQAFKPALNSGLKEISATALRGSLNKDLTPKEESVCPQKRFLVFDQSGDQTTLMFSSGIGTNIQCFSSWGPDPTATYNFKRKDLGVKENLNVDLGALAADQFGEDYATELQSEMHEDTEELNALLYSDDESDSSEDDEVTSTGHSPSTMTSYNNEDWFVGNLEDVASSDGSTKRRKLFGGYSHSPALMDTASSMKPIRSFPCDNDAESRCEDGLNEASGEMGSEPAIKRIRKEKIRETVNILQNIIPGGKGKDAIVVLDEAINYLKSLKVKAKALGLDAP